MSDFDVCACGDYRHQHDARGCLICRAGRAPWDNCSGFRLFKDADPNDPNVSSTTSMKPAGRRGSCAHCGHALEKHTAKGRRCPIGRRHRTLGFTQFHKEQAYAVAVEGQVRGIKRASPKSQKESP